MSPWGFINFGSQRRGLKMKSPLGGKKTKEPRVG